MLKMYNISGLEIFYNKLMKLKKNAPSAEILMTSMRAMGYSFEAAIADVIDNSISAHAKKIQILFPVNIQDGEYIAICDDGDGMSQDELFQAMRYGSPLKSSNRATDDLGRFGLGMKSASLSQCRRLTVVSKKNDVISAYVWDLDIIEKENDWVIQECDREIIDNIQFTDFLKSRPSGTIVLWESFDLMKKTTNGVAEELKRKMEITEQYLSLIFHRYLNGEDKYRIAISINNYTLKGMDPFLESHNKTDARRVISINIKDSQGIDRKIQVKPFVLPFQQYLTEKDFALSGGRENYRSKQGFYIYRNKRLIIWGKWFGYRNDEMTKYARIKVDIPNTLDDIWSIDIKKQHASIPPFIKEKLKGAMNDVRDKSIRVQTFRGRKVNPDSKIDFIWDRIKERGNQYVYRINRRSKIFDLLRAELTDDTLSSVNNVLDMILEEIENNLPYQQIYIDKSQNNILEDVDEERLKDVESKARILIKMALKIGNRSKYEIIDQLFQSEPFNHYQMIASKLKEEDAL